MIDTTAAKTTYDSLDAIEKSILLASQQAGTARAKARRTANDAAFCIENFRLSLFSHHLNDGEDPVYTTDHVRQWQANALRALRIATLANTEYHSLQIVLLDAFVLVTNAFTVTADV